MKNTIIIIIILIAFTACKNSDSEGTEKDKIKLAQWLLGKWENKSVEGSLTENWKKVNDSTYKATSYFTKGKDTLHFEFIDLQQIGEALTYTATIKGQNNDKPVAFSLTFSTDNKLVFENPTHDYPQKISYSQISKDSIVAEISGIQQGKPSTEKYLMARNK